MPALPPTRLPPPAVSRRLTRGKCATSGAAAMRRADPDPWGPPWTPPPAATVLGPINRPALIPAVTSGSWAVLSASRHRFFHSGGIICPSRNHTRLMRLMAFLGCRDYGVVFVVCPVAGGARLHFRPHSRQTDVRMRTIQGFYCNIAIQQTAVQAISNITHTHSPCANKPCNIAIPV